MSSPRQAIMQARQLVEDATWIGGSAEAVVGTSAYITPELADEQMLPGRVPFALLNLGEGREDPEDAELMTQDIYLVLATSVAGHDMGQFSITGGAGRETGKSRGRGLLELQIPILRKLALLKGADDTVAKIAPGSAGGMKWRDGAHLAWRQFTINLLCSLEDEWPPPRELTAAGNVLSWTLPPARFDLDSIILRSAAGSTPPASETDGDPVVLAADLSTSHDVSALGAGEFSFALFAKYVDTNDNDPKHSPQETGSTRTVTIT